MRQKKPRPVYNVEIKTLNSEQSSIDIFSKIESLFLEKYFRFNISDYFYDRFSCLDDQLLHRKGNGKKINQLTPLLFQTKVPLELKKFEQDTNKFYEEKSNCEDLSYCFKHLYSNIQPQGDFCMGEKQLAIFQVKIKADVQKIQDFPAQFYKELELSRLESYIQSDEEIITRLKAYRKDLIHLFLIYYGDVNFYNFKQQHYNRTKVNFFEREVYVNIHVFYISRMAMLQTFKKINRIQSTDLLNQLVIQLYQFKREKLKKKKKKAIFQKLQNASLQKSSAHKDIFNILKWITLVSVSGLTIGTIIFKFIH